MGEPLKAARAKHTPGPWTTSGWFYPDTVEGDVFAKDAAKVTDATPICRVYKPRSKNWCADKSNRPIDALTSLGQKFPERKVIEANARLIAAAPDLLALLIESQTSIGGDWRERRDAAISKAIFSSSEAERSGSCP